jgi:hypothetical protein
MSDKVFTELSERQLAALGKPCTECGKDTVEKRTGRFGPWVQCRSCGAKVYRPRGRPFGGETATAESTSTERTATEIDALEASASEARDTTAGMPPEESKPSTDGGVVDAAIMRLVEPRIDAAIRSGKLKVNVDADTLLRAARTHVDKALAESQAVIDAKLASLEAARVTRIEVVTPTATKYVEGAHFQLERLVKLLGAGFHVYCWGPAGSGKTTAALQAAEALDRRAELDTLDPSTFRSMVQGYMTPTGEPVHTAFTRCWSEGKVYVADETDNAPGHVQTLFNSALANGHAPLAWGNVARPDGFGFVGTGNTPGRPTRAFPDRKPMSAAFMDRLYFIHWPLDPAIECRAAGLALPAKPKRDRSTCTPEQWGMFVRTLRTWAESNAPTLMITPRATLAGLKALTLGEAPSEVADALIFRGADDDLKHKALTAVALPGQE